MKERTFAPAYLLALGLCGLAALTLPACGGSSSPMSSGSGGNMPGSGGSTGSGGGSGGETSGTGGDMGSGGTLPPADAGSGGASADAGSDGSVEAAPDAVANPDGSAAFNSTVMATMRKVADWQLMSAGTMKDWIHGAMWTGFMAIYDVTKDMKYLTAIENWAGAGWALNGGAGARGDDQCAAQTFFEAYLLDPVPANMVRLSAKSSFDQLVANTPAGRTAWWWEDALFMVPPGFARLGAATGDKQYFATMNQMYWDSYAFLWSPQDNLMFRDHQGNDRTQWARGNGWVIAGAARVLEYLPMDDPKRPNFVKVVTDMAGALKPKQGTDGCWRSDLRNANAFPNPETSGTAFFTFGIAWGVNNGILDKAMYQPVAQKGWDCLVSHVDASGKLGYVQAVGGAPGPANPGDTQPYAIGGMLLAGKEVGKFTP